MSSKQHRRRKNALPPMYGSEAYAVEKIEAYNVAIEALRIHEPADGDPTGIAYKFRMSLADKLDREIDRWYRNYPQNAEHTSRN